MSDSRREFFRRAFLGAGVLTEAKALVAHDQSSTMQHDHMNKERGHHETEAEAKISHSKARDSASALPAVPVQTPDVPDLPSRCTATLRHSRRHPTSD